MKGYEQYGNRGEVVDNNDKVVGYYQTIGYDRLVLNIKGERKQVSHSKLVEELDRLELHAVSNWN